MTNRIMLCSSLFLMFALGAQGFADEHFPFLAEVSKESVNVRSGPNTNFEKVDKLNRGDKVVVLGHYYEWYKVQPLATTKAFIRSDYLKLKEGDLDVVIGDNVNVRAQANSDSSSLGEIKEGAVVKVLGHVNGWSSLAPVAGTAVWIHQDFLKEVSPDVPESMLIPEVPVASEAAPAQEQAPVAQSPAGVSPWVSMRGTVEALVAPVGAQAHYEIVLDDKSVFLLQDIPQIAYFCNSVVNVEGAVVPDPQKKLMYPLLHINKITLVL